MDLKLIGIGRVVGVKDSDGNATDWEVRTVNSANGNFTSLRGRIACLTSRKDGDGKYISEFVDVRATGSTADFMIKHFHKGNAIRFEAEPRTDSYEKDGKTQYVKYNHILEVGFVVGANYDNSNKGNNASASAPAPEVPAPEVPEDGFMSMNGISEELPSGWGV